MFICSFPTRESGYAILSLGLGPDQSASVDTSSWLDSLASSEALPQVAKEVGLLLDVAFAKKRGNGPSCFISVVERNAPRACQLFLTIQGWHVRDTGYGSNMVDGGQTYGNMWWTTWYSMMPWKMWRPMKPKSRSTVEAAPLMKVQFSAS